MKCFFLATILLATACQAIDTDSARTAAVEQGLDSWCGGNGGFYDQTMPPLITYYGQLPANPQTNDYVVLLYGDPVKDTRFWAVFIDGPKVVAWQDVPKYGYAAYQQKLISSGWGWHSIPRIGVTPPPTPPDGTGDYARLFLEIAHLEHAVTDLAAERAASY